MTIPGGEGACVTVTTLSKTWQDDPASVISHTTVTDAQGTELVTVQVHLSEDDGAVVVRVETTEAGERHPLRVYAPDHAS